MSGDFGPEADEEPATTRSTRDEEVRRRGARGRAAPRTRSPKRTRRSRTRTIEEDDLDEEETRRGRGRRALRGGEARPGRLRPDPGVGGSGGRRGDRRRAHGHPESRLGDHLELREGRLGDDLWLQGGPAARRLPGLAALPDGVLRDRRLDRGSHLGQPDPLPVRHRQRAPESQRDRRASIRS